MGNSGSSEFGPLMKIHLSPGDEKQFRPQPLPLDADGFVQSFPVDRREEILEFFERHGVVVVSNVLTDEQCSRSVDEVWLFLKEMFNPEIDRNDPSTWQKGWPSFSKLGILGNERWLYPQACDNRQNPNIYQVFRTLFGENELIVNVTRAGLMRPTKDVFFPSLNKTEDRPDWVTVSEWLHLDMNPLTGRSTTYGFGNVGENHNESSAEPLTAERKATNNGLRKRKLQAIVALDDCREEDGGFHAVPGFQHYIRTWTRLNKDLCLETNRGPDPSTVQIPADDPIRQHIQRMPIRKGSLLVWDSRLPHGNFPNQSNHMRIVQYLHMAPVSDDALESFPLTEEDFPPNFQMTALGAKLYGFHPWPSFSARRRFRQGGNPAVFERAAYERAVRKMKK